MDKEDEILEHKEWDHERKVVCVLKKGKNNSFGRIREGIVHFFKCYVSSSFLCHNTEQGERSRGRELELVMFV